MPKHLLKWRPIPFNDAVHLMMKKKDEAFGDRNFCQAPGQEGWYSSNFVAWIASLGYHIELCGDEFDLVYRSQLAA